MPNYFQENRKKVQQAIFREGFILPILSDTLVIKEDGKNALLKEVEICDIPFDIDRPVSWLMDMEFSSKGLFSNPQGVKTSEKVLLVMTKQQLLVCMIEMKSTIQDWESNSRSLSAIIDQKFRDTIDRVCIYLPINIHDASYDNIKLAFTGVVCYNHDKVSQIPTNLRHKKIHQQFKSNQKYGQTRVDTKVHGSIALKLHFFKNPVGSNSRFSISFSEIFPDFKETDLYCLH